MTTIAGEVYIENEARQFGLEERVRICRQQGATPGPTDPELRPRLCAASFTFPVLRTRLWAVLHGHGWPPLI